MNQSAALIRRPVLRLALLAIALVTAAILCAGPGAHAQAVAQPVAAATSSPAFSEQELAAWRTRRAAEISAPDGWLTLAALDWLKPGLNSIGSASENQIRLPSSAPAHLGLITVMAGSADPHASKSKPAAPASIQLLAPSGGFPAGLTVEGKPAREGTLTVSDANASRIAWNGLSMVVLERGDRYMLRIKDADAPARSAFRGLNWYPPDPRYRVTARWIPFKPPLVEEISTVIGATLKLPAPGLAMFLIDGKVEHLEPVLEDPQEKTLFFILRDPTSKTTTYGGGRFLHAPLPDHGLSEPGNLTLDFNRLENPPCAYTDFATCPLPPPQNQLDVAIEGGEKRYER